MDPGTLGDRRCIDETGDQKAKPQRFKVNRWHGLELHVYWLKNEKEPLCVHVVRVLLPLRGRVSQAQP